MIIAPIWWWELRCVREALPRSAGYHELWSQTPTAAVELRLIWTFSSAKPPKQSETWIRIVAARSLVRSWLVNGRARRKSVDKNVIVFITEFSGFCFKSCVFPQVESVLVAFGCCTLKSLISLLRRVTCSHGCNLWPAPPRQKNGINGHPGEAGAGQAASGIATAYVDFQYMIDNVYLTMYFLILLLII